MGLFASGGAPDLASKSASSNSVLISSISYPFRVPSLSTEVNKISPTPKAMALFIQPDLTYFLVCQQRIKCFACVFFIQFSCCHPYFVEHPGGGGGHLVENFGAVIGWFYWCRLLE